MASWKSLNHERLLSAGDLNLAFGGGDGRLRFSAPVTGGVAVNVAAQPDGKFVVGGYALQPHKNYVWLERFDAKGNVDKTFGSNGVVKTLVSNVQEGCFADFARQADGKFVVVTVRKGGGFLARYTSSGKLDRTFGAGDGIVLTNAGYSKVLALPNGKIAAFNGDVSEFNSDGSVYTSFGTKGVVNVASVLSGVKNLWLRNMSAQPDSKILLTGAVETTTYTMEDATVTIRLTTSGKADKTLNGSGMVVDDIGFYEGGWGVATQSNGNIITVATDDDTRDWLLGASPVGGAIPGFKGGINDFSSSWDDILSGVSIFGKDQILMFGAVTVPETGRHDFIALGFDASGVRQFRKGIDFSWTDVGETNDVPVAAIQSADGNILIVGNSGEYDGSLPTSQIEIASLQSKSGGPSDQIPIQRVNGQATLTGTAGNDVIRIVQGEGYGIEYNGNRAWGWESKIVVTAGAGNDLIANLSDLPTVMNGGSGNDTMVGGTGTDTFQGGGGTDTADYSVAATTSTSPSTTSPTTAPPANTTTSWPTSKPSSEDLATTSSSATPSPTFSKATPATTRSTVVRAMTRSMEAVAATTSTARTATTRSSPRTAAPTHSTAGMDSTLRRGTTLQPSRIQF